MTIPRLGKQTGGTIIASNEQPPAKPTPPKKTKVPAGAVDAHIHLIDYSPKFQLAAGEKKERFEGNLERYREVQRALGIDRVVVIHTAMYKDNRNVLDMIAGDKGIRGIAIVGPHTSDAEWRELEACDGSTWRRAHHHARPGRVRSWTRWEALAKRMESTGRHLQMHIGEQMLIDLAPRLEKLPGTLVIDHFGRLEPSQGPNGTGFKTLARLLSTGRVYCKLAAPNRVSHKDPPYEDIVWLGRALVDLAPERMLWGTDWPNVNWPGVMPDAGMLMDCLSDWAPDEKVRNKILVDNPVALYKY